MSLNTDEILLIQDYLSGKLSKEEIIKFEEKLADPKFKDESQLQKEVRKAIMIGGRNSVKQIIKEFEVKPVIKKPLFRGVWMKWSIAASLLIFMTYSISHLIKPATPEILFASNFELLANVIDPLARGEAEELSAYQLYENRRYSEALDLFSKIDPSQNKFLYEGLCYIELEQIDQSILKFEDGLKMPSEGLKENLEWYLLLAYIKNGNTSKALEYSQELKQNILHQYFHKIESIEQALLKM